METVEVKKGSFVTREQLINAGYKHKLNYGAWEIWSDGSNHLYYEPKEGEIKELIKK